MGSVRCGLFATSRFDHCSPSSIADYFRQGAVVLNLTLALPGAVACGKGQKERLVPLSPRLLTELREYWKQVRSPKYLFPGATFDVRISATTMQKLCQARLEE